MSDLKADYSFGAASFESTSPGRSDLSSETAALNVIVPFRDAMQLSLSLDEAVRKLNRYKMSTRKGKDAAVKLIIRLDKHRIEVHEA